MRKKTIFQRMLAKMTDQELRYLQKDFVAYNRDKESLWDIDNEMKRRAAINRRAKKKRLENEASKYIK